MGKATGFLEYERRENRDIPPLERIKNFSEFHIHLTKEEREKQGARCMNCGVPFCQSGMKLNGMYTGCPLHNLIPEWNDEVYNGHIPHALSRLLKTNNFPEFTGRVCPALCEKACIEGLYDGAVTTHDNELYIIESAWKEGGMVPRIPEVRSGKKVAVVGAGPAGLAAADQLNHRGHSVTVYEKADHIGGLLMYGIPNMKLDKSVIDRRQSLMEAEGVVFRTGVDIGKDITAGELFKEYDAVILACGAKQARGLQAEGIEDAKGVYFAVDYLTVQTRALMQERKTGKPCSLPAEFDANGKHVVIVGGGDTGNDCVGTAIRQGAKSVTQIEMMPCPPTERAANNPWPEWPKVLKTDYGQQEAIAVFGQDPRRYERTIKSVTKKKNGQITQVITSKVCFRDGKLTLVEGSEEKLPCDLLLIAAGFTGCERYVAEAFEAELTPRNVVKTAEENDYKVIAKGEAAQQKLFTAGDMHRGQSLVVWAIAEGRACAKQVDAFLMGYSGL